MCFSIVTLCYSTSTSVPSFSHHPLCIHRPPQTNIFIHVVQVLPSLRKTTSSSFRPFVQVFSRRTAFLLHVFTAIERFPPAMADQNSFSSLRIRERRVFKNVAFDRLMVRSQEVRLFRCPELKEVKVRYSHSMWGRMAPPGGGCWYNSCGTGAERCSLSYL